jgi:hypothetical protein
MFCEFEWYIIVLAIVLYGSVVCFVFSSVIDYSTSKEICIILLLIAGEMESRCVSKATSVKEVDSLFTILSGMWCYCECH